MTAPTPATDRAKAIYRYIDFSSASPEEDIAW